MQHARTQLQGGKSIAEHQVIQLQLSEMNMLTEALRSFVMRVAWERDQALPDTSNNVLVMNYSTDVIQRVTHLNMDIHGAAGFTMDASADKLVRDGIIWTHLAGDTVQRMKVVKRLVK
jgi:alkylation response protein AidB-like acyl-CoA dehydrogenase